MNTQPTVEEKARFFALYWGQKIAMCNIVVNRLDLITIGKFPAEPNARCIDHIILKDISSISSEDERFIFDNFPYLPEFVNTIEERDSGYCFLKENIKSIIMENVGMYQYALSRGYALPFMQYSVEQMISFGWIKIIE